MMVSLDTADAETALKAKNVTQKVAVLPFLQVAYQTRPFHTSPACKRQLVIVRIMRFEAEDFDEGASLLMEMQTGLDDLRIVVYHERMLGQIVGDIIEIIIADLPLPVDEQLAVVARCYGKAGYTAVGQLVAVIADLNMLGIHVLYIIEKITATA